MDTHHSVTWDEYAECCLMHDQVTLHMILHEDRNPRPDGAIQPGVPVLLAAGPATVPSLVIS